jgi:acetyl esterase/lipase
MAGQGLNAPMIAMAPTSDGQGYWLLGRDGGVFSFGDAHFYGSTGNMVLNAPVVSMAAAPDGEGYWFVASDGGIFTFGSEGFYGSMGGTPLNQPIVGMAPTPDGRGYWLVASDGGIFAFGDATFYGSMGGTPLNQPIVGMASSAGGHGYWLVAADGGIFAFGDAGFYGSAAGSGAVGITPSPNGAGYWIVNAAGRVSNFGDAPAVASPAMTSEASGIAAVVTPAAIPVTYGSGDETALAYPSPEPNSPMVVLVHGGGWTGGSNTDSLVQSTARYLQLHNVGVLSVNYTLATPSQTAFPNQPQEVGAAAFYLRSNPGLLNGDPGRISLVGGSAGGTIVLLAEHDIVAQGLQLRSVVDLSGPSNFTTWVPWIQGSGGATWILGSAVTDALGCGVLSTCNGAEEQAASFVNTSVAGGVKWLVAGSQSDALVPFEQTQDTDNYLSGLGQSVEFITPAGGDHAFEMHWAVNSHIAAIVSS